MFIENCIVVIIWDLSISIFEMHVAVFGMLVEILIC